MCEKDYIWNPATCSCKNGRYLASIIDDSVNRCDAIVETTKSTLVKIFPTKNTSTKNSSTNFYVLLDFLFITITLIAVSIYCYLLKYRAKQKHYHITSQLKN